MGLFFRIHFLLPLSIFLERSVLFVTKTFRVNPHFFELITHMIATLLSLAGINVNVKYEICSWQSGQKNTSWIGPGRGGEHIYIYIYTPPQSPPFLGYSSGQGVPYMYIFCKTINIYIYIYVRGTSLYYVTALQFSLFSLFTFGDFQLIKKMKKIKTLFSLFSLFTFGDFQLIKKMKKIKSLFSLFSLFTFGDFQLIKKMKKIKTLFSLFSLFTFGDF